MWAETSLAICVIMLICQIHCSKQRCINIVTKKQETLRLRGGGRAAFGSSDLHAKTEPTVSYKEEKDEIMQKYKAIQLHLITMKNVDVTCVPQGAHAESDIYGTVMQSCWHRGIRRYTGKSCHNLHCVSSNPIWCHSNCYTYHIYASFQHALSWSAETCKVIRHVNKY